MVQLKRENTNGKPQNDVDVYNAKFEFSIENNLLTLRLHTIPLSIELFKIQANSSLNQ